MHRLHEVLVCVRGEIFGITVNAGETTNVGFVTLFYIGDDQTPPDVVATDPADGEICVPTAGIITADLNDDGVVNSDDTPVFSTNFGFSADPI